VIEAGRWLWDVRVPVRDGVALSVDLHLPPDGLPGGPYPAVLVRTAEGNQRPDLVTRARALADAGFAVVLQDVRGREDSEGRFAPFRDEGPDGYDTVEWVAAQEWCTGKVGMMGSGYAGWTQWAAARERPPHLTALASTSAWSPGPAAVPGTLSLERLAWLHAMSARVWQEAGPVDWGAALRHVPLRDAAIAIGSRLPVWEEWLDEPDAWRSLELTADDYRAIDLPVLHLVARDDPGALARYEAMRHAPDQVLVLGDGDHADLHKEWFTHWLTDAEQPCPSSRVHVTGADTWRDEAWEPVAAATTLYLGAGGVLSPSAAEGADSYDYDPDDPVLLTTDLTFFPSPPQQRAPLPDDRRFLERRPDVLVYTADAATEPCELSGRPRAQIRFSSNRTDTDVFVQLSDVSPSGRSQVLATGGLRARSREGLDREVLLTPGEVVELPVELSAVAHVLLPGHRLRLAVTSSWFPLADRNLNTGEPVGSETGALVATNTVHGGSRLDLPVKEAS
jgi:putative CocE/NonD family hydrolase